MKSTQTIAAHETMAREKRRVALTSIVAAVFLTGMKLAVGLWTGSLGILSEAAHSGLDLVAAGITFYAVRMSDRPPDDAHNFGHHKIENLSALAETLLLLITCVWILYEAYQRLVSGYTEVDVNTLSFAVIGLSIIIDIGRSRALMRVAKKYKSQALEADALHFSTDIYSSAVVIVGLVCVHFGFPAGDAIAAAMVALIVIWISIQLGKRTIDVLLDTTPAGLHEKIAGQINGIEGVEDIRSLRIREAGSKIFVDLVIGIARTRTFDEAHATMDSVEKAITEVEKDADVMVHSEPVIGKDERLIDSLSWIIQQESLFPHNIVILRENGIVNVHLDIEFPPGTGFESAHNTASTLEDRIRGYLPHIGEVIIHLEEARPEVQESTEVTQREEALMNQVCSIIYGDEGVLKCSGIRCYETARGLKIAIECSLAKSLSLRAAHSIVDRLEKTVSVLDPRILKVFIHAEPV